MCVALCPNDALVIDFNEYGEYNSCLTGECIDGCSLCLDICPFNDNQNEDELAKNKFSKNLNYDDNLGFYLNTYSGYAMTNGFREKGASGGLTTWLLEQLLKNDYVDYVINVKPNRDNEKLFKYQIAASIETLREGSGSAYYPIELSEVIEKVLKQDGKYAIVGLPCFLKAVELAKEKNKKLADRIIFSVGLVCGQLKSKEFTNYIAQLSGFEDEIEEVSYRNNSDDQTANNFYFHFENKNNNGKIYFKDGIGKAWSNRWFTYNSCSYCDDTFSELADVTLMDAWLSEFTQDSRGTNLLAVRNEEIEKLLMQGKENKDIILNPISSDKVISSQQGVINIKRDKLSYRLSLVSDKEGFYPKKRVNPNQTTNLFLKKEVEYKDEMQEASKKMWKKVKDNRIDFDEFSSIMQEKMDKLNKLNIIRRIFSLPKRIVRKSLSYMK
ncbi:hypothetical protein JCM15060_05740 [Halanaerobaculum tunisiense]